jgi:hypothetical protein
LETRERRTKYLEKNPARGGIPAMDNRQRVIVIAKRGFDLERPLSWDRKLDSPKSLKVEMAKVNKFKDIII